MALEEEDALEPPSVPVGGRTRCVDWPLKGSKSWNGSFFLLARKYSFNKRFGPTFSMDGVDDVGNYVHLTAHGFLPRFYVRFFEETPRAGVNVARAERVLGAVETAVKKFVHSDECGLSKWYKEQLIELREPYVVHTEVVKKRDQNSCLLDDLYEFVEVQVAHPQLVQLFANFLANPRGRQLDSDSRWSMEIPDWCWEVEIRDVEAMLLYNSNVDFDLVFESTTGIGTCAWYDFDPSCFVDVPSQWLQTRADFEKASVHWKRFEEAKRSGESKDPPLRAMAFDIEAENDQGRDFPDPKRHRCLQICAYFYVDGGSGPQKSWKREVCWILEDADSPLQSAVKFEFADEKELLHAFASFVSDSDPDLVLAHNGNGFDWPFLVRRAEHLGLSSFGLMVGRYLKKKPYMSEEKVKGHTRHNCEIPGRTVVDTLRYRRMLDDPYDCRLAACAKEYLKRNTKIDLPPEKITIKQRSREGRTELLEYCFKDAELVMLLANTWHCLLQTSSWAKRFGVPPHKFLNKEISAKVDCILTNQFAKKNCIYLDKKFRSRNKRMFLKVEGSDLGKAIRGAITIPQKVGYYVEDVPPHMISKCKHLKHGAVTCNDFSALYPNVIIQKNIGPETVGHRREFERQGLQAGRDFEVQTEFGEQAEEDAPCFLRKELKQSVVGSMLDELYHERRAIRKTISQLKEKKNALVANLDSASGEEEAKLKEEIEGIEMEVVILDSMQLAIKLAMNSTYGAFGYSESRFVNYPLADSVTRSGRNSLLTCKQMIEDEMGYQVVFGDTDSLGAHLRPGDDADAVMIAVSKRSSELLGERLVMAPEKRFQRAVFTGIKKNYQDRRVEFGQPDEAYKIHTSGCRFAKKTVSPYVAEACKKLQKVIFKKEPEDQLEAMKETMLFWAKRLADGKVTISELIEQAKMGRDASSYSSETVAAHVCLRSWRAACVRAAEEGVAEPKSPGAGQIVQWVVCEEADTQDRSKKKNKSPRAWSPEEVAARDLTPSLSHYKTSLMRQFASYFCVPLMALAGDDPDPDWISQMPDDTKKQRELKIKARKELYLKVIGAVLAPITRTTVYRPLKNAPGTLGHYFARKRKATDDDEMADVEECLSRTFASCKVCAAGEPKEGEDMEAWHERASSRAKECAASSCSNWGSRVYYQRKLRALRE